MDDFPVIVPEDDGFAIYLNDERVDWYNNEADAEGVALSMVDKELNDESFFDRPLEESVSNDSDLKNEIVKLINATNNFKVKAEGHYVRILYSNTEVADFNLEEGMSVVKCFSRLPKTELSPTACASDISIGICALICIEGFVTASKIPDTT